MPMDDDKAMISLVKKEWLANPSKIGLALLLQFDPRANPGMDK